jgi:hypothetical protein
MGRLVLDRLRPPCYKAVVYFLWFKHKVITPMITKQKLKSAVHVTISITSPQQESDQPPKRQLRLLFYHIIL